MNAGRSSRSARRKRSGSTPPPRFVLDFLGSVNLFRGRVHRGRLSIGGLQIDVPEHAETRATDAVGYVRAHELDVARDGGDEGGLAAVVILVRRIGPIVRIELERLDTGESFEARSPPSASSSCASSAARPLRAPAPGARFRRRNSGRRPSAAGGGGAGMSSEGMGRPGFHAIMMAAAYAEEGLGDHAREILEEGARERAGTPAVESSGPRVAARRRGPARRPPRLTPSRDQRPAARASRARRAFSAAAG